MSLFPGGGILSNPGTGMHRWDGSNPAGNNAWAVFEFTQAAVPFWVLIQFSAYAPQSSNTVTFGNSPGAAVTQLIQFYTAGSKVYTAATRDNCVAVMIAFMPNGSSPWLGTTANNGADTRPASPWSSNACIFPRGNDQGGAFYYNRYCFMPLVHETSLLWTQGNMNTGAPTYDALDSLYHVIVDRDNLLFLMDAQGIGSLGSFFYFGKFSAADAANAAPYVCLMRNSIYNDSHFTLWPRDPRYVYGNLIPNGAENAAGLLYTRPDSNHAGSDQRQLINGGVYDTISGHAGACSIDYSTHQYHTSPSGSQLMNNDLFWASSQIRHEVVKPIVYLNDYPYSKYARLGVIDFFKVTAGVRNGTFFGNGTEIALGNAGFANNRVIVPWCVDIDYGRVGARAGQVW